MSQFNLETPSITASTTSGTELAADLSSWRTALHTSHSGSSVPSYAAAGMQWYDSTNSLMKFHDGTDSFPTFVVDATNNRAYPSTTNPKFQYPLTTGGTVGQYNLTLSPALTALVTGDTLSARINTTLATDTATLNVNGTASADIRKMFAGSDIAVVAGDLVAGQRYLFQYDSAASGGSGAWILLNPPPTSHGKIILTRAASLTIATGVITVTGSHHAVDTQASAATDDLDTINGGVDGMVLVIRPVSSSRTIVVKNGTGNITCRGGVDISLGSSATGLMLVYNGATWMGNT